MKILVITQYFWPESFKINDLCLGLVERGHEVTVLTGKPNYPAGDFYNGYSMFNKSKESWNNINIIRSPLVRRKDGRGLQLIINYLSFAVFSSFRALFLKKEYDRIFVYEPSPVTVGIPAIIARWKTKTEILFWVQDLWPESISAASGSNNSGWVIQIMDSVTRFIYKHSSKILVQSKAFIPYIINQGVSVDKLIYYPNSTEAYYQKVSPKSEHLKFFEKYDGLKIVFAGNIGESQSFDTLLSTASILKKDGFKINWFILGDGRQKNYVRSQIDILDLSDTFFLLGSYPSTEMASFFACADALLVSLRDETIFAHTIPSKVQSYLACAKPIIASLNGEGSRVINEANAGFCSPAENVKQLVTNIIEFSKLSLDERNIMGDNAREYFNTEFERELLLNKLEDILKKN